MGFTVEDFRPHNPLMEKRNSHNLFHTILLVLMVIGIFAIVWSLYDKPSDSVADFDDAMCGAGVAKYC